MAVAAEAMSEDERSQFERLTGTQKSAILMMLLGEDEASEIVRNLSPKEVQHLGTAMYSVQGLDQDTVNAVLDEFLAIIKAQTSLGMGAGNYIRNVMNKALGEDKAQSVLSRIAPSTSARPIEILDWMDARSIAELIIDEHPQIIALIISYLDAGQAADVLGLLPESLQSEIVRRIATLQTVGPDALAELENVMQSKFKANASLRAAARNEALALNFDCITFSSSASASGPTVCNVAIRRTISDCSDSGSRPSTSAACPASR